MAIRIFGGFQMKALKSVLVAAVALSGAGYASAYNFELSGSYYNVEAGSVDGDGYGASAAAYFHMVDDTKGPLAEAGFLDRASGIMFSYDSSSIDGTDVEFRNTALSARMVNKESGWTGELLFNQVRDDYRDGEPTDKANVLGVGVGKYLSMNSEVSVFYTNVDEYNQDAVGVNYHHVFPGDPTSLAVNLNVTQVDVDGTSETDWSWDGTLYFTDAIGVGVGYYYDGFYEEDSWDVHASWFVLPELEVALSFAKAGQLGDDDVEIGAIRTTFRF